MASPSPLIALNQRFEIPGIVKIVEERAGFPAVRIQTPDVAGEVQLYGAHVTSWRPTGEEEALFLSTKTKWQAGTAIRGGVPICFPWFADRTDGPKSPAHGLVRTKPWKLEAITHADSNVTVALSTSTDEATRKSWLCLDRARDGSILVTAEVRGKDGKVIASISNNVLTVNENRIFRTHKERPDKSTLIIKDEYGETSLYLRYLNPHSVSILGKMYFAPSYAFRITEKGLSVDGYPPIEFSKVCLAMENKSGITAALRFPTLQ